MLLRMVYDDTLAQASYLLGCPATGEALVIDPNRNIDQYIELARSKDLRITAITETHIHADFVSGSRELAQKTGAQLYLSDAGPQEWKYSYAAEAGAKLLLDGDTFHVGNVLVQALHTPGHTPEHLSFMVTDTRGADKPMGIFTGDFIFVGDVGRPDLLERAAGVTGTMEPGARALFRSLQKMRNLPEYLQIWPAHGAGSACGRALGAVPQTTLGYEKLFNWAFAHKNEDEFVRAVLDGQPEPPFYFAEMKRINKVGPGLVGAITLPEQLTLTQLSEQLAAQTRIVDTRSASEYAEGHIPGTINIPLDTSFLSWAGWLLPYDRPFYLIVEKEKVVTAIRELRLIGLEHLAGFWTPELVAAWQQAGHELETLPKLTVADLQHRLTGLSNGQQVILLDVRGAGEYRDGYIAGSMNIPLGYVERSLQAIPTDRPVLVQCQAGTRSAVAASVLQTHGYKQVTDVVGGFEAWQKAGYPIAVPAQETALV